MGRRSARRQEALCPTVCAWRVLCSWRRPQSRSRPQLPCGHSEAHLLLGMPLGRGYAFLWLPSWLSSEETSCQCRRGRRHRFDSWVRKIPWRRNWEPTPVFLPGKCHGQRSQAVCSPWGCKQSDPTEQLSKRPCLVKTQCGSNTLSLLTHLLDVIFLMFYLLIYFDCTWS